MCSGHSMDLLALSSAILPAIITTLRFGANSVWATVFGRLLCIVLGNIRAIQSLRTSLRFDLRAFSASISPDQSSLRTKSTACSVGFEITVASSFQAFRNVSHAALFRLVSAILNLYNQVSALQPLHSCVQAVCASTLCGFVCP